MMTFLKYFREIETETETDTKTLLRIPNSIVSSLDSIVVSISTDNKLVVEGVENRQDFSFNFVSSVPLPKNIDPESITKHQFGPILTIRGRVFAPNQFLIENSNNEFI